MPALIPTPDDLARIALELDQAAADICDAAAERSRDLAE